MQNFAPPGFDPSLFAPLRPHGSAGLNHRPEPGPQRCVDHLFVAMLNGYRNSGGLARIQEVMARFRRSHDPDPANLANWIARRQVICFEWQSQTWLPLFQFKRCDMAPPADLGLLFAELNPIHNPWELAHWFARPHPRLADHVPAEMVAADPAAVLRAARADRLAVSA